jgi:tetratricopeptide (TPR) repeat protein
MMRVSTTLATGLFATSVLIATVNAQTVTPTAPTTTGVKAEPKPAQPVAPTATQTAVAKPGDTKPVATPPSATADTTKPVPAAATAVKPADKAHPQTTGTKTVEKAQGPDKKTKDNARKAYNDANTAFKTGKFDVALVKFQEAESLIPSANAEYWIAATYDKLDRKVEALAAYATYLANEEAAKAGEDKLAEAKTRFDNLRATVPGDFALTAIPADALVTIDGQAQTEKGSLSLKLSPGDHKILVTLAGYEPQELTVTIEAGKKLERSVELKMLPPPPPPPPPPVVVAPPPPPPPPPPPQRSLVPAYVTLAIAGVAAGTGTYFGVRALSAKSDYDDKPTASKADDVENNALIADMAFGVAITLGVTGIVLLTTPEEQPAQPAASAKATHRLPLNRNRLVVSPWATPRSAGAGAVFSF